MDGEGLRGSTTIQVAYTGVVSNLQNATNWLNMATTAINDFVQLSRDERGSIAWSAEFYAGWSEPQVLEFGAHFLVRQYISTT